MRGIKIHQQDFCAKNARGGLMREGAYLRDTMVHTTGNKNIECMQITSMYSCFIGCLFNMA